MMTPRQRPHTPSLNPITLLTFTILCTLSTITALSLRHPLYHSHHNGPISKQRRYQLHVHVDNGETQTNNDKKHAHTLAILTMPHSTSSRIANEAILQTAMSVTSTKLSVVVRTNTGGRSLNGEGFENVSLTRLRRYAGEIYSMAWDTALNIETKTQPLLNLIVYPQNLPNTPPEGWIANRPDLTCICSHDSITGWVTSDVGGSGEKYAQAGRGGLNAHVEAVNAERISKGLGEVQALHVDDWPDGAEVVNDENVVFLEDDVYEKAGDGNNVSTSLLGGSSSIPPSSLYTSVAVGGTFDGLHYGHRKLLTLAISSVQPINGKLLIGVTRDEMLKHKAYADKIPPLSDRIEGVLNFIGDLAPGMKNRIKCIPISDEYGPPGMSPDDELYSGIINDFDALVLSHETLTTGRKLNTFREGVLGLKPLKLLCTQRTEPYGMSSTAMRRLRSG